MLSLRFRSLLWARNYGSDQGREKSSKLIVGQSVFVTNMVDTRVVCKIRMDEYPVKLSGYIRRSETAAIVWSVARTKVWFVDTVTRLT